MSETTAAKLADTLRELLPSTAEGERVFDEVAALLRSRDEEAGKLSRECDAQKIATDTLARRRDDLERAITRLTQERDAAVQEAGKMREALRDPIAVAESFHEHYERLAPDFGYATRDASAVPWDDVPVDNKRLMVATASEVLAELRGAALSAADQEAT